MDAVIVMGKTYAPGGSPAELRARAAFGVACWRHAAAGAVWACLEGYDQPQRDRSGAAVAAAVAQAAGVPSARIVALPLANCTVREVLAIKAVLTAHTCCAPLVVTHPYHVPRTRRYLRAVGVGAPVVGCTLARARALTTDTALLAVIAAGAPSLLAVLREWRTELLLHALHTCDPAGIIEQRLADRLRGGAVPAYRIRAEVDAHAHRH